MALVSRKIVNICRFCLCQDENKLGPIEEILPLTVNDVERFTGVKIDTKENISYVICFDCTQKLKISADFRQFCINNNAYFEKLLCVVIASTKSVSKTNIQPLTHQEQDPLALHFVIKDDDDEDDEEVEEDIVEIYDDDEDDDVNDVNIQKQKVWNDRVENYSANYIDIGEHSESDEHEPGHQYSAFSNNSINKKSAVCTKLIKTNNSDEAPQVREIVTHRSKKSYRRQYLCDLCGKLVSNYIFHIDFHANERKHACPHCPLKMNCSSNLAKHIKEVHLKVILKTCSICSKDFTNKNSYVSHMRAIHGDGDRFTCTVCSRLFKYKSNLGNHMRRTHSNIRNVACDICDATFKFRQSLTAHMSVHSTDQPYPCSKCPKRFKSRYAMKIHEITHTGKMFDCGLCGKTYRYKSLLNMHMRKMHSVKVELPKD